MKVEVEVSYIEEYVPPRCRKPREREASEAMALEVAEAAGAEAPVAARVHLPLWKAGEPERSQRVPVRFHGGRLYLPLFAHGRPEPDSFIGSEPAPIGALAAEVAREASWTGARRTRRQARLAASEAAGLFLVVDGEPWRVCGEPRYVVQTFGLGHNHASTNVFVEWSYNPNIAASRYYNANDREAMQEGFRRVALGRGDTDSVPAYEGRVAAGTDERIEVLIPGAFTCDPASEHGDGDEFLNGLESLAAGAGSAFEAGLLALAFTAKETAR